MAKQIPVTLNFFNFLQSRVYYMQQQGQLKTAAHMFQILYCFGPVPKQLEPYTKLSKIMA